MRRGGARWRWAALWLAAAGACDRDDAAGDAGAPFVDDAAGTCPAGMALVRGGEFVMGSSDLSGVAADGASAPAHRVRVRSFCLDETPVTAVAYVACVDAGRCPTPAMISAPGCAYQTGGFVEPGREAAPMNCVDWSEADTFCRAWANGDGGAALPTEAQWEFAATNGGATRYPWGDAAPRDQLCWSGTGAVLRSRPCLVTERAASARGLRDMVGNVSVWTQDWFANYAAAGAVPVDPSGPPTGRVRTARGPSFGADRVDVVAPTLRSLYAPTYRAPQLGFRCARALVGNPG